jgi:vacuolar-type H+-ATPase subunit E/Vma4
MMQTAGSVASIVAAIREDAAAEVERIEQSAAADIAAIRKEEQDAVVTVADRDVRLAAAWRENQERLAQQEWEGRRAAIEQREAWLARVIAMAGDQWQMTPELMTALVREALQNVDSSECEVAVAQNERHLLDPAKFDRKINVVTASISGGCIVTAGPVVFDNSLDARAKRLETEWRKALGEVYRP